MKKIKKSVAIILVIVMTMSVSLTVLADSDPDFKDGQIRRYGAVPGSYVVDSDFSGPLEGGEVRISQQIIKDNEDGTFDVEVKVQAGDLIDFAVEEAIVLVIDGSGSVTSSQWQEMMTACISFIESHPVRANVFFGVVVFDNDARVLSNLDNNRGRVIQLLRNATQVPAGETNTTDGLIKAKAVLDAYTGTGTKSAIVITDGESNVSVPGTTLQQAADALKSSGTVVYAIGVGEYKLSELELISTLNPHFKTIFPLIDFTEIAVSLANLIHKNVNISTGPDVDFVSIVSGSNAAYIDGVLQWDLSSVVNGSVNSLVYRIALKTSAIDQGFKPVSSSSTLTYTDANKVARNENFDIPLVRMRSDVTVTFNDWDGTVFFTQTLKHGMKAEAPAPAPVRSGFTFLGWYLGNDPYDFDTPVTADIVLVAQYNDVSISIIRIADEFGVPSASQVTLPRNSEMQFDIIANIGAIVDGITWKTSNAAFAIVDQDGLVKTKNLPGSVVLTATAENGVTHSITLRII